MNRTVRLGVATTLAVVCLSLLDVSVFAQKKRKPRRKRAKVTRIVLPSILVSPQTIVSVNVVPQTSASANNIQVDCDRQTGHVEASQKLLLLDRRSKRPGQRS